MSNTLKNNAYHILGLDTSSDERNVLKRSKEIINRLKAGDSPEYDLDIGLFKNFRDEDSVKDALQRLQAPKKRIKEYFFWFQIADSIDEQVLGLFKLKDYLNAIRTWESASESQTTKGLFYKKNLAILYCLVLSAENNKDYLKSSLIIWKELIDSDKFWVSFSKVYKLHDEQTASEDIIDGFRKHVVESLSDIYTELHDIHNDADYVNEFQKIFSIKGEKIEKTVLAPAYQTINKAIESLEKMEVSKDGKFDKEEAETIRQLVAVVQGELNKLIDLGLFDDSQTKIMRDRSANALRTIVLDLHNNLNEFQKSHGLLEVAIKLAGTESLKTKLQDELVQIQKSIADDAENSLGIEIPGTFRSSRIIFKNSYAEYNSKRIYFKDVVSVSYHSTVTQHRLYGVPAGKSYSYSVSIVSDKENFSISLSASSDKSKQEESWVRLVGLVSNLIEPIIVKRYVEQIFDRKESVKIGEIEFTKMGYSKEKFKLFGKNEKLMVYWTDTVYIPKLYQGSAILWEEKDGKSQVFATVPMSAPNAVVLPELIKACVNIPKT